MFRGNGSKPFNIPAGWLLALGILIAVPDSAFPQRKAQAALSPPPMPGTIPDDVQLVNPDVNPTLRIPVMHSSLSWTLLKPRIRASYGWLEIDRANVRYFMLRPSRTTKEPDQAFDLPRSELVDLKFEYNSSEFRARALRHFFGYCPPGHWESTDAMSGASYSSNNPDVAYSPLILEALQNFDNLVEKVRSKQQPIAPPPVAPQPVVQPAEPAPAQPLPVPEPPTLVVLAPSVTTQNQTVEVSESPLTVRGVVMDQSGLPTIKINGAIASLRPKGENAAEFWSDPIELKPGDNSLVIVASNSSKADLQFPFVAHFTPKAAPVNPRALGKAEIVALLQGGVPESHVVELVRDRGVKFAPTAADLDELRAAGGSDELVKAIQQAALGVK